MPHIVKYVPIEGEKMRRNSKVAAIAAIGVVGVGMFGLTGSSASQAPTPQPVVVANGAASPVPVAGTVNVGNLPATQAVSGSVNVANLPATQPVSGTVNVGNLPETQPVSGTVGISGTPTVNVGNLPETQPVSGTVGISGTPTVSVQERQPFHGHASININAGNTSTIAVPAGQRLVIQSVSMQSTSATMTSCTPMTFWTTLDGPLYYLPMDLVNSTCHATLTGEELFWTQQGPLNVIAPNSASTGVPVWELTVSGYLVPAS
jgi:hypothetical protein